jgi:hypothetical protein
MGKYFLINMENSDEIEEFDCLDEIEKRISNFDFEESKGFRVFKGVELPLKIKVIE